MKLVLKFNYSTWNFKKEFNRTFDICQREHLKWNVDIKYPDKILKDRLYQLTNYKPFSNCVGKRRSCHLGHDLRRNSSVIDTIRYKNNLKTRPRHWQKRANILKAYGKTLGCNETNTFEERAIARRLQTSDAILIQSIIQMGEQKSA